MNKHIKHSGRLLFLALLFTGFSGCKKYLEVPLPIDQLSTQAVYQTRNTIVAAVNGMYNAFGQGLLYGNYIRFTYIMSDEGEISPLPGTEFGDLIAANVVPANQQLILWSWFYLPIYRANDIIERLPQVANSVMPEAERKQYVAAAKYVRAATHFLLANGWGDVPLITTTSTEVNINKPRTPVAEVYAAVVQDLQEAAADLPTTVNTADSRTIHNRFQALALLSRVYLYLGRWAESEAAASEVINSTQYQLVTGVNNVFRRGSREAIFSMGSTGTGLLFDNRAVIGWLTLPASAGNTTTTYCAIPSAMFNSFEPGDQRRVNGNWVITLFGKNFANKYLHNSAASAATISANPQDFIYQRLAEVYLNRAEARAQQGRITGANSAASDINLVRTRAGLPNTTAVTQTDMLAALERERVYELFYEGHRWHDLKRTGRLNAVLSAVPYKAANYKPHYQLWPIPLSELNVSPNLTQNPGY